MAAKKGSKAKQANRAVAATSKPKCGLCGKTRELMRTDCCGNWVCDDEDKYVMFSYARTSCSRNHRRYTLCGFHAAEQHKHSDWKTCGECRESFDKNEEYVHFGTNEYNFTKLENPPSFEPTHCTECGDIISLSEDGYSTRGDDYFCEDCSAAMTANLFGSVQ